jgi:hypothetical protein
MLAPAAAAAIDVWQAAVGYDRLTAALGPATPIGAGVAISMVEAGNQYMPDGAYPEFNLGGDPLGQAVALNNASGISSGISTHATFQVGQYYFGNTLGLAKGANQVSVYQADNWLNNFIRYSGNDEPAAQPFKVQNHSWIHSFGNASQDQAVLRRLDYVIERDDMTTVVGANNNGTFSTALVHPNLLVHSYNAIVAGRSDSGHSRGATNAVYGPGRFRPDIVSTAPASNFTSTTTAQVSGAAAVLRGVMAGSDGDRSETTKAILLAGATKTEFASFVEPVGGAPNPWGRTATQPLDDIFGAGELNIYNSYLMTVGGQHAGITAPPASAVKSHGWDYQNRKADGAVGDIYYNFIVPGGSTAQELSIILSWNVKVTDTNPSPSVFTPSESLQNLDLTLYNSTAGFLATQIDQSISTVDNVEHIYQTNLGAGTYTLKVSGAANWDYGLAWRLNTLFNEPNADFDDDGAVTGTDFLAWQRNLGKLVGATHGEGDANGDGAVDATDLQLWRDGVMPAPMFQAAIAPVPEPAAIASAALALGFAAAALRRRRSV